ncbi:MAG: phosphatidate cytidylyltransferase [Planctomycetaceae bacterium]|jgi:phosphatidate cytidylyltransferase|nr:phosphatidate cytidylyltransferase [Planctomycetaceae bacterium]
MLKLRLLFAIPTILVLLALAFLDNMLPIKGAALMPVLLISIVLVSKELLDLFAEGGLHPRRSTVYLGSLLMALCCWGICVGHDRAITTLPTLSQSDSQEDVVALHWAAGAAMGILFTFAGGILIAFSGEMWRYKRPGGVTINLAGAVFMMGYLGLLSCFIILLRMTYGLLPLLTMIAIVKMNDAGAYTIGRIFGRHKMAPELSPKKTVEGGIGGVIFAIFASWFCFCILNAAESIVRNWFFFGLVIAISGSLGDLAASLIKRDVGKKDSGSLIPGFGGFLDLFDSLILAAPVAFFWWTFCVSR